MARLSEQNSPSIRTPKGEAKGFRRLFSSSKSRNFSPNATDKQPSSSLVGVSSPVGVSSSVRQSRLGRDFDPACFTPLKREAEREVRNDNMSVEADDSDASTVSSSPPPKALPRLSPRLSKAVKLLGLRPEETGADANEVNIKSKIKLITVKNSEFDGSATEETMLENSCVKDSGVLRQPASSTTVADKAVAADKLAPAEGVECDEDGSNDSTLMQPYKADNNTAEAVTNAHTPAAQSALEMFFETTADGKDFVNDLGLLLPRNKSKFAQIASDVAAIDCTTKAKTDISPPNEQPNDHIFAVAHFWALIFVYLRRHAQIPNTVKIGPVRIIKYGSVLYHGMALFYAGILVTAAVAGPVELFMVIWRAMVIFVLYSVVARNLEWETEGTDLLLGPMGLVAWEIIASFATLGGIEIQE